MAVDFYLLSSVETHLKRVNHEDRRYAFRDDDLNMFIYENSLLLGD